MKKVVIFFLTLAFFSCVNKPAESPLYKPFPDTTLVIRVDKTNADTTKDRKENDTLGLRFTGMGLVNVQALDSSIRVDLKYSSTENFFGVDVYGTLKRAYLQPDVAHKLSCAQELLHNQCPHYNLLIYDAARPAYVQWIMWDTVKMPVNEKIKYLSNPRRGSLHNFGAAVDITIADSSGVPLDMGTEFDYFGELAYPVRESVLLQKGNLTQQQIDNRKLLRMVMKKAGFFNIQTEWWHFNSCTRAEAELKYKIIE